LFDVFINIKNPLNLLEIGTNLKSEITLIPVADNIRFDVTAEYIIKDLEDNTILTQSDTFLIEDKLNYTKEFITTNIPAGDYILSLELAYPDGVAVSSEQFRIIKEENPTNYEKTTQYLKEKLNQLNNNNKVIQAKTWVKEKSTLLNNKSKTIRDYQINKIKQFYNYSSNQLIKIFNKIKNYF
jgi:hypothetical protein